MVAFSGFIIVNDNKNQGQSIKHHASDTSILSTI